MNQIEDQCYDAVQDTFQKEMAKVLHMLDNYTAATRKIASLLEETENERKRCTEWSRAVEVHRDQTHEQ